MIPLLAAEQEGVRLAAVRGLSAIIKATIDSKAAASAVALARAKLGGAPSAVESVASAIEGALGPRYSDSLPQALQGVFGLPSHFGEDVNLLWTSM
jgi:hypothetical protein